jgi:hypothetical protein
MKTVAHRAFISAKKQETVTKKKKYITQTTMSHMFGRLQPPHEARTTMRASRPKN